MKQKFFLIPAMLICLLLTGCGANVKSEADMVKDLQNEDFWRANKYATCEKVKILERQTDEEKGTDDVIVKVFSDLAGSEVITIHELRYRHDAEGQWFLDGCFDEDEDSWQIEIPESQLREDLTQALQKDYPGISIKSLEVTDTRTNMFLLGSFLDTKVQFDNHFTEDTHKIELIYHISADGWKFHDFEWISARPRL